MQISFHPKAKKVLIILGAIAVLGIAIFAACPLLHKLPLRRPQAHPRMPKLPSMLQQLSTRWTIPPILTCGRHVSARMTTEAGCRAIHSLLCPGRSSDGRRTKIQTSCTVIPVRLVSDKGNIRSGK